MKLSFLSLRQLHMLLRVEVKVVILDRFDISLANNLDIFFGFVVKSYVIIESSKVILYMIVTHVIQDQHNVRCMHFMQL